MKDNNLTDAEIPNVKELLEYKVKAHCELCDLKYSDCCGTCIYTAIKQFIELFNRQEAEIEELNKDLADTIALNYEERKSLKAEIERLKAEIKFSDYLEYETTNQIKAEAYKEFAERLKDTKFKHGNDYMIYAENIDNLLKELGVNKCE
jgi:hypothetical protein